MILRSKIMKKVLVLGLLQITACGIVSANTDDAGVLGGLESNSDIYNYLNTYNYTLLFADHRFSRHDMYISADKAVIVSLWDSRVTPDIYIIKPGYGTNKGVTVGMERKTVESVYGRLYYDFGLDKPFEPYGEIRSGYGEYSGYYIAEYIGPKNSGLSFVFNQYNDKVVLIRYQHDRHGNSSILTDVKAYGLLPYLR